MSKIWRADAKCRARSISKFYVEARLVTTKEMEMLTRNRKGASLPNALCLLISPGSTAIYQIWHMALDAEEHHKEHFEKQGKRDRSDE